MTDQLPVISLQGNAAQRGESYGSQARARIEATFEFYEKVIFRNSPLSVEQIRNRAYRAADLIDKSDGNYTDEIGGIAIGSGLEPWQIYVLNARTEILNANVGECTALYFQDTALMGQTWDWIRQLEDLAIVVHVETPEGRSFVSLTEPGMLAKIGMNDRGVGACLNFLMASQEFDGVPVHVTLRALMDCESLSEARGVIERSGCGKSSHILMGDSQGDCFGVEFAGGDTAFIDPSDGVLMHTNHCIAPGMESTMVPTSRERLSQAGKWVDRDGDRSLDNLGRILSDDSLGNESILSCYHAEPELGGLDVGTCATVLMDLPRCEFHVRKGPTPHATFQKIAVGGECGLR